jgi:hypothetical protein
MDSTNDDQGPPTQAEVEAISRELTEAHPGRSSATADLCHRAAVMIARLERAWLEASSHKDETGD